MKAHVEVVDAKLRLCSVVAEVGCTPKPLQSCYSVLLATLATNSVRHDGCVSFSMPNLAIAQQETKSSHAVHAAVLGRIRVP